MIVMRFGPVATSIGAGGGGTIGLLSHDPASSHVAAVALASSQSHAAVDVRRNLPWSEPDAKIGHSHFFQPFFRSSNSPERDSSRYPAAQSRRWRR